MEDHNEESRKGAKNLRDAISSMKANEELIVEGLISTAILYGERLKALMNNDFTREEAVDIIIHRGLE